MLSIFVELLQYFIRITVVLYWDYYIIWFK